MNGQKNKMVIFIVFLVTYYLVHYMIHLVEKVVFVKLSFWKPYILLLLMESKVATPTTNIILYIRIRTVRTVVSKDLIGMSVINKLPLTELYYRPLQRKWDT